MNNISMDHRRQATSAVRRAARAVVEGLESRTLLTTTIVSGQTIAGSIASVGQTVQYSFSASAGNTFDITLGDASAASALHPYIQVFAPDATRVINSGTGGTNTSVGGIFTVPAANAGTYTVIVQDDFGTATGAYDLELAKAPGTQAADSNGDGGVISSGQTKAGTINRAGDLDVFTFSASANDSFDISLGDASAASALHPYLQVYNPSGTRVINTGTGGTNTSVSGIFNVPAAGAGTYTVIVQDDFGTGTGAYDLELAKAPATQAADSNGDGGVITSGQTKAGTINRTGDLDVFTFTASANDTFDISLGDADAASALHPYLQVYNPSGARVVNTGTGGTNTSVNGIVTVPAAGAGTYTVIVQDDFGTGTGAYDLELAKAPSVQAADSNGDGGVISSGQTKAGTINRTGDLDVFTFSADANDSVDITFGDASAASALHPYMQVYNASGARVVNTGTGGTNTSVNGIFTVPAAGAGTYTVIVQDDFGTGTGAYDLELAVAPAIQAADSNGDGGPITSGQTKAGTINRTGDLDVYTFSASSGDTFDISLADTNAASGVHPYLQVYNPSGARVVNTGTGGTNTSVSGIFKIPSGSSGTFTVIAQDDFGTGLGGYNLELTGNLHPVNPTVSIAITGPAVQTATAGVSKSFTLGSFAETAATGPYSVDVNWGDGSADTKFSVAAPGTIPAQSHTYATSGSKSASIVITDAKAHTSNKATFGVTVTGTTTKTASIAGNIFKDTNANGVKDTTETGLSAVKVYIDANKNGVFDTGEVNVPTDASGNYKVGSLAAGTYRVREVLPSGFKLIVPAAGFVDVVVAANAAVTGKNFADAPATASISGEVFNDANANAKLDSTELGLGLWQVFIDTNKDGKFDTGDISATTDINGKWSFTGLTAGTYAVRVTQVSGTATTTTGGALQTIVLTSAQAASGKLFGEKRIA